MGRCWKFAAVCAAFVFTSPIGDSAFGKGGVIKTFNKASGATTAARAARTFKSVTPSTANKLVRPKPAPTISPPKVATPKVTPPPAPKPTPKSQLATKPAQQKSREVRENLRRVSGTPTLNDKSKIAASIDKLAPGTLKNEAGAAIRNIEQKAVANANRAKNKLSPIGEAVGPHTTLKRGADGRVTNYATYKPNPRNPSKFDEVKRVDLKGKAHYDKKTRKVVRTPHVHEKGGEVRPARAEEIPRSKSSK